MATSIGPWISPGIILLSNILVLNTGWFKNQKNDFSLLNQVGASLAGLAATAIGFCLPTLYFLDPTSFAELIKHPIQFCMYLGFLMFSAGSLGTLAIITFGKTILDQAKDSPISNLFVKTHTQSIEQHPGPSIFVGAGSSSILCLLRDGLAFGKTVVIPSLKGASFFAKPTMLAVGYTLGKNIIAPLVAGILLQKFFIYPIATSQNFFGLKLASRDPIALSTAFCCGILLFELVAPLFKLVAPKRLKSLAYTVTLYCANFTTNLNKLWPTVLAISLSLFLLKKLQFSFSAGLFIIICSIIASIEISRFLVEYGMVPFGRFATFVMLPAITLFSIGSVQITTLCLFVTLTCAAGASLTMQRGVAQIAKLKTKSVDFQHWFSLAICSLTIGAIFWLLLSQLQPGSSELFAQRGKMRALLISAPELEKILVATGLAFGFLFQQLGFSVTMIFGGLAMPQELSFSLIIGALIRYLIPKTSSTENFWAGVFVGEAVLIILLLIFKLTGKSLGF
jgi:hypothetical protein